jgi:hypothetical protein
VGTTWTTRALALGAGVLTAACASEGGRENDGSASDPSIGSITITAGTGEGTTADTEDPSDGSADGFDTGAPMCAGDEDCPPDQHCGEGSKVCVGPTGCVLDEDCDDGFDCKDGMCTIGGDCGGFAFEITAVPPNMLILLDRSGSMDADVSGTGMNRWEVAREAVRSVTMGFEDKIRFGLATYSSCTGGGCSGGSIVTPLADMNSAPIMMFLDSTVGVGSGNGMGVDQNGKVEYLCDSGDPETSTGKSLNGFVGEPSLADPERTNAILLITDGAESGECIDNGIDGPAGASALFLQDPSVATYAVGFGDGNPGELDQIAIAGGTNMGYFAEDPMQLDMALDAIASAVASCTFTLDQVPPDPSMIFVFFDLDPLGVPNDPVNGWTYDEATNSITFHGTACESIKSGAIVNIDIVYGCNMPPIG